VRRARPVAMYDAIEAANLPPGTAVCAGYVGGSWPSYLPMRRRFPTALVLSIAVASDEDAMVLDVERGDATPETAATWLRMMKNRGLNRPCLYTSVSAVADLERTLLAAGHPRSTWRLWTAHYTGEAHICGKACGYALSEAPGATQWSSGSRSRQWDTSSTTREWVSSLINDYHGDHP
jgi:hypothetical protein